MVAPMIYVSNATENCSLRLLTDETGLSGDYDKG